MKMCGCANALAVEWQTKICTNKTLTKAAEKKDYVKKVHTHHKKIGAVCYKKKFEPRASVVKWRQ